MALTKKKKIWITVTASIAAIIIISLTVGVSIFFTQPPPVIDLDYLLKHSPLAFSDEFYGNALKENITIDGKKVDKEVWRITDTLNDSRDPANQKPTNIRRWAYCDMNQVKVADGAMTITTEKKDGRYYTAGLSTVTNVNDSSIGYEHKYGFYEMRAILPKGYGQWAAFWMMSNNFGTNGVNSNENGAEIDIFEAPAWPKPILQQAVHKGIVLTASIAIIIILSTIIVCCVLLIGKETLPPYTPPIDTRTELEIFRANNPDIIFSDEFDGEKLNKHILLTANLLTALFGKLLTQMMTPRLVNASDMKIGRAHV